MARIYNNPKDYTSIHHLLEVDGKLSALAGNLIFVRSAIGFDAGRLRVSRIFPLLFDLNDLDIF